MLHPPNACVGHANFGLVLALLLCFATSLLAQTWGTSGDFQTIEYADRVTVRGTVNAPSGVLQIPASINGKPVTAVADWAFDYSPALVGIALPPTLIEIGRGAFQGCGSLQSVTVPSGVTAIADSTFAYCSSLASVTLPASVTAIGEGAFRDCDNLASIVIPQGVTIIGNSAFNDCALLKTVTFPASLRTIGDYAFDDCTSLESVVLPEGLTSIGQWTFATCSALTSVKLPSTLTSLGPYAFYQCRSLTEIGIPAVTSVGDYAFAQCDALARATIAAGVGSIGEYAFYDCVSLTSISVPASVTAIGRYAFYYCSGLVTATIAPGISRIPEGMFQQCSSLTTANVPEGVTSIGSYAFQNCSLLASISMPSTVTSIGNAAFRDCSGLSSVVLSAKLTSIPPNAFQSCSNLASVSIPAGVTTIGEWAFSGCSGLTEAVIPATVLSIGQWAFAYANLAKIELPDSVTSIGQHAFYECSSAQSLRLPAGLTGVANYAFGDCHSLTSIVFPSALQSIGEGAFRGVSLAALTLPEGLVTIGAYAFQNSDKLQSVNFPASLASVGASAFSSCSLLAAAQFAGNAPSLGASAFSWAAQGFAVYYRSTATGFSSPTWQGYPAFVAVSSLVLSGTPSSFNATPGTASAAQAFTVSGNNLTANVTVSAPSGFELSIGGGSYAVSVTLAHVGGLLPATAVSVRLSAGAPMGSSSGNIVVSSTGASSRNLAVSGTVAGVPSLELTGTLTAFSTTAGSASTPQSFAVGGSSLRADVALTAPAGFELAVGEGTYGPSATLAPVAGSLAASTISVRISASANTGPVGGEVTIASTGATSRKIAVNGTVTARPTPVLNVVGALSPFKTSAGNASQVQTFAVSGMNLTGSVTLTAPSGFELSSESSIYASSLTLASSAGSLGSTAISVRVAASAPPGPVSGDITIASAGATVRTVAANGLVDSPAPPAGAFIGNFSYLDAEPATATEAVSSLGQLVVNSSGTGFSLVAIMEGRAVRGKGSLNFSGPTRITVTTPQTKQLRHIEFVYVALDRNLQVTIKDASDQPLASTFCFPAAYNTINNPFAFAGRRLNNLLIARESESTESLGHGFLSGKARPNGVVALMGRLSDNVKVVGTMRFIVPSPGEVAAPLCLPLARVRGLLWGSGRLDFGQNAGDALLTNDEAAPLIWSRSPNAAAKVFPQGLLVFSDLYGRLWTGSASLNALTGDASQTPFTVEVGGGDMRWEGNWDATNRPAWDQALPSDASWKVNPRTGALTANLPIAAGATPSLFRGLLITPGFEGYDGSTILGGGFGVSEGSSIELEVSN